MSVFKTEIKPRRWTDEADMCPSGTSHPLRELLKTCCPRAWPASLTLACQGARLSQCPAGGHGAPKAGLQSQPCLASASLGLSSSYWALCKVRTGGGGSSFQPLGPCPALGSLDF